MSPKSIIKSRRVQAGAVSIGAAVAILGGTLAATGVSGADFNDSKATNFSATAGTLRVSFPVGSDLRYTNLVPGVEQSANLQVQNDGSIAADGIYGQPINNVKLSGGTNLTNADLNNTEIRIVGNGKDSGWIVGGQLNNIDLGYFQPGANKSFTVYFRLTHAAGNEWQGATVTAEPTVTLNQHDGK